MISVLLRRASILIGALFFCASAFSAPADACQAGGLIYDHQVARIYDGDTLLLKSGKKIRLIGINTPETGKQRRAAEPYANAALKMAKTHIAAAGYRVGIVEGKEKKDRYGRTLAHVFLPGGTNLTTLLLQNGMGHQIAIPPNLAYLDCYARAEASARSQQLGVWRLQPIDNNRKIKLGTGFRMVAGKVTRIGRGRSNIWLNFNGPLAIRIQKNDLRYFTHWQPSELLGKTIEARGWVYTRKGQLRLQIRHPAMMRVQ